MKDLVTSVDNRRKSLFPSRALFLFLRLFFRSPPLRLNCFSNQSINFRMRFRMPIDVAARSTQPLIEFWCFFGKNWPCESFVCARARPQHSDRPVARGNLECFDGGKRLLSSNIPPNRFSETEAAGAWRCRCLSLSRALPLIRRRELRIKFKSKRNTTIITIKYRFASRRLRITFRLLCASRFPARPSITLNYFSIYNLMYSSNRLVLLLRFCMPIITAGRTQSDKMSRCDT